MRSWPTTVIAIRQTTASVSISCATAIENCTASDMMKIDTMPASSIRFVSDGEVVAPSRKGGALIAWALVKALSAKF